MFGTKTYADRRKALANKLDSGIIVLMGNHESRMNYVDNVYPFRQDSRFLYYFGIDKPGMVGVIDAETGESTLFGDDFTVDHIVWMGPQPTVATFAEQCGAEHSADAAAFEEYLKAANQAGRKIHYLPQYRHDNLIQLSQLLGQSLAATEAGTSKELILAVVDQCAVKTEEELAQLELAVNLSVDMHEHIMRITRPGMTEQELVAAAQSIAAAQGSGTAYPIIMTINGQTLHNHYHGNTIKEGDLLLFDMGAESPMYYAGDLTRTIPVAPTFTSKQKDIYNIVLDAEVKAIEALRPGVTYKEIHLLSSTIIANGLKDLGLMKGNTDDAVAAGAHAMFFPHGLGHMMGLDVHDMEGLGENLVGYDDKIARSTQFGLRSLRLGRELDKGFVLTVEPGIYFIPELIAKWKNENINTEFINFDKVNEYLDFGGIRIEDDVILTDNGADIIGKPLAKTVEEVENLRG